VTQPISDIQLKTMRDIVYGKVSSIGNWMACRDAWRRDEKWLVEQFEKVKRANPA